MSDLLLYVLPGIATGFVIGWIARGSLTAAQSDLERGDRDLDRSPRLVLCTRCGRWDGSHTSACERARLDQLVPPLRGRKFDARSRGYAGADGQDLPQSSKRGK